MFFASVATEEGRLNPVGIVYAEDLTPFTAVGSASNFVQFAHPSVFNVGHVAKLALACTWPGSFLVVTPAGKDLHIAGIGDPPKFQFPSRDRLVRVTAPRPGVLAVGEGEREMVHYERGELRLSSSKDREQLESVERAVLDKLAKELPGFVSGEVLSIVRGMVGLGRGGLLAILGPDEELEHLFGKKGALLDKEATRIDPPLDLGAAIFEEAEAHEENGYLFNQGFASGKTGLTKEEVDAEDDARKATERVNQLREQVIRLTAVDGAVVMSHKLEVLAFGAMLPAPGEDLGDVFTLNARQKRVSWSLEGRGTRHRAAAAFVSKQPKRLSIIVSQDGHAGTFQGVGDKLQYLPL
nr:diadenylate cyclase [Chondromyces apiculatus]